MMSFQSDSVLYVAPFSTAMMAYEAPVMLDGSKTALVIVPSPS